MLDFRFAKNGGYSSSPFGESYAFGMAGTGGTISSSPTEPSILFFGVGSLEVERLCEMRAEPAVARQEL